MARGAEVQLRGDMASAWYQCEEGSAVASRILKLQIFFVLPWSLLDVDTEYFPKFPYSILQSREIVPAEKIRRWLGSTSHMLYHHVT
jgi:hypothetical protein